MTSARTAIEGAYVPGTTDADFARTLRDTLFRRHLGVDTKSRDDRASLQTFGDIARANRDRLGLGASDWQGRVFALRPET